MFGPRYEAAPSFTSPLLASSPSPLPWGNKDDEARPVVQLPGAHPNVRKLEAGSRIIRVGYVMSHGLPRIPSLRKRRKFPSFHAVRGMDPTVIYVLAQCAGDTRAARLPRLREGSIRKTAGLSLTRAALRTLASGMARSAYFSSKVTLVQSKLGTLSC